MMTRVRVSEDPAMTARFPGAQAARIEADAGGRQYVVDIDNARGNAANPLSDAEIDAKFRGLAAGALPAERVDALLSSLWAFDEHPCVTGVIP